MIKEFLLERKILLLTWLMGLMLLLQVFNLHSYVASAVDHQAIVAANDDDASWNIAKTVKTRWWKDNGWVLYGPLYFRINHSIQYFLGRTADLNPVSEHETWEKTAHHSIMTISLLSVVAVSLLVGSVLLPLWWMRFLFAIALNSALLSSSTWAELVLRAHPDHLFTLFVVMALWLTVRMFDRPQEKIWRVLSATFWGLSVSVKMTLSLCLPGFVLLFVPPFAKARWKQGLHYLGVMLLAYFAIGFPQTIVLDRPFRELKVINGLSTTPTGASVVHWLQVYAQQLWGPLLVLVMAALLFPRVRTSLPAQGRWRLFAFVTLPFVILLFKNMLVPADHYAMPFVGMFILMFSFWLTETRWLHIEKWQILRGLVFFAVSMMIWGSTPATMQAELEKRLHCRTEAREVYKNIFDLYQAGEKVWVDPYVPYITIADKDKMEMTWEKTVSGFEFGHWTVLALNKGYRERFAQPNEYTQVDVPNWREVREFYLPFKDGDVARMPKGETFRRTYSNSCGQEIWRREP